MSNGATAGATTATAAHQHQIAQAIKASGAIISVEPPDFLSVLSKTENPLVVVAEGGFLKTNYQYLTAYKGLVFFTKSDMKLTLSGDVELVNAKKIWIPG